MNESIKHHLEKINSIKHPKNVLDVGCGTRPYESIFHDSKYIGLDVYQSGRKLEHKIADIYFDGINIPVDSNSFDMILCTQVLEHCIDPDKLMREMHRVLTPGGCLVLTLPFVWPEHEIPYDFRRFSFYGAEQLARGLDFKIDSITRITCGQEAFIALIDSIGRRSLKSKYDYLIFRICMKLIRLCFRNLMKNLDPNLFYLNTIAVLTKKIER
jgi:ubiquinone/menaquinone biosynthesis C-methylase UbiE